MKNWHLVALLVAIGAGFVALSGKLLPGQPYRPEMIDAGASVATALLVVTLFVERSMAVVNAIIWGEQQRQAEADIRAGSTPGVSPVSADKMAAAQKTRMEILTKKERLRLILGFLVGIFVSAAGIRTLEALTALDAAKMDRLFLPVDVLLTAGLIAGGSNGLAFLIQLLKDLAVMNSGAKTAALLTTTP